MEVVMRIALTPVEAGSRAKEQIRKRWRYSLPEFPNEVLVAGTVVALVAILAGCGGGSSKPTISTSSSGSGAQPSTKFSTASVSGVGNVVVDGRGRTVYILTSGDHTNAPCTDASGCTKLWPDLPLPGGMSAAAAGTGIKASLLGTMKLSDGETYPTYRGWLMYEYTGDSGPGQANGEGIKSFGGTWYVLNPSGNPITSKSGGSGGGGGY
jgi:predicted lipoprotein with Yx(FWY)xxD motif